MGKLISIGEALVDMIPAETGKPIKEVLAFSPVVGGAPANVCGAFSKLGGISYMITQLGEDPFGDKIMDNFKKYQIRTDYVKRTEKANTALAFVSLMEDGNREFSFYRKPSADMLLAPEDIKEEWFEEADFLHFCSVSLSDSPMKQAHKRAIEYALLHNALISFDPNLRFNLWDSLEALYDAVWEFLPYAHILKVSDEELTFITGIENEREAIAKLFTGNVSLIVYTMGSKGAVVFTRDGMIKAQGVKVKAVDTTGAGDAFIGSFLFQLGERLSGIAAWRATDGIGLKEALSDISMEDYRNMLAFSNSYCAKSVLKNGAIASYPTIGEMKR